MSEKKAATPDLKRNHDEKVLEALRGIEYGSVEVVIHASEVVQIIRKEKIRFDNPNGG